MDNTAVRMWWENQHPDHVFPGRNELEADGEGIEQMRILRQWYSEDCVVVDYGCGYGRVAKSVAHGVVRVVGLDVAHSQVEMTNRALKEFDHAEAYQVDEISEEHFADFVYCLMVMQHNPAAERKRILEKVRSMMKKSTGVLYVTYPRHASRAYGDAKNKESSPSTRTFTKEDVMAEASEVFDMVKVLEGNIARYSKRVPDADEKNEWILIAGYAE